ncbi:hypothetical protein [Streptomyces syringium]|uniref:hypothetical protein n=1 Tax=Streptomyces syringium TaxID=76729 RepID=UPI003AAB45C1
MRTSRPVTARVEYGVAAAAELVAELPLDLPTITGTVAETLRPVPAGARLDPDVLEHTAQLLAGQVQLVLPLAQAAHRRRRPDPRRPGLVGYGLAYMRARMEVAPPSPRTHPLDSLVWCQETARGLQQLLGVALVDDAAAR